MGWLEQAEKLRYEDGMTIPEVVSALTPAYFRDITYQQAFDRVRGRLRRSSRYVPQGGKPRASVDKPEKPKKPEKVVVVQNYEPTHMFVPWKGNQVVRFALIGDTHIGSKYTQLTHLNAFYDECARQGIKHVYHAGDIDEGDQMRKGHSNDCYVHGADEHVAEIIRVYPKRDGIATHFCTGNHDASIWKNCGYNIGPAIAEKRSDIDYLGQDCAVVSLTPNCTLELRHPWSGSSYAISYKPQKMIDAMSGDEKPNILAIAHFHKVEYLFYRNVHAFQTGCFQGQTPFSRGMGLSVHMGGWIIEASVDEKGHVQKLKQEFVPYYASIIDDYKKWR